MAPKSFKDFSNQLMSLFSSSTPKEEAKAAGTPDFLTSPDAVLKDEAAWRYGRAPDYSNTREVFRQSTFLRVGAYNGLGQAC